MVICNGCGKTVKKTVDSFGLNLCIDCHKTFKKADAIKNKIIEAVLLSIFGYKTSKTVMDDIEITKEEVEDRLKMMLR